MADILKQNVEEIFYRYHVDIVIQAHRHDCKFYVVSLLCSTVDDVDVDVDESSFPVYEGKLVQANYNNPKAPICNCFHCCNETRKTLTIVVFYHYSFCRHCNRRCHWCQRLSRGFDRSLGHTETRLGQQTNVNYSCLFSKKCNILVYYSLEFGYALVDVHNATYLVCCRQCR
jgi:hypothetical protein